MDNEVSFAEYIKKSKWHLLVSLVYKINIDRFKDIDVSYTISNLKFKFTAIDNIFDELINNNVTFKDLGLFFERFNILLDECLNYKKGTQKYIPISQLKAINDTIINKILLLIYDNNIFTQNDFENEVAELRSQGSNAANKLKQPQEEREEASRQAQESLNNIKELERQLSNGQGENGLIKTKIEEIYSTLESKRNEIFAFYNTLTKDDKDTPSLIYQIRSARDEAVKNNKMSVQQYKEISKIKSDILEFRDKIFGVKDSEGTLTIGLDEYIENGKINLEDITNAHNTRFKELEREIEGLLPGATSIGLSDAFSKMQSSFSEPIKAYSRLFYLAMAGILAFGGYVMYMNIGLTGGDANQFVNGLFLKLPILIALVWLAIFASKRRSEYIRLQQEYAHKEVLAKTYEGFKKQIIDLGKDAEPLMDKLIANAIIAISFNPSTTLDGKHGDKPPVIGAVEKLVAKIDKILPDSKVTKDK